MFLRTAKSTTEVGEPSAAVGKPADFLLLPVTVTVRALAVVESTLTQVARLVLGQEGGSTGEFIPGSVSAVETGARIPDTAAGEIRSELRLQGNFARNLTSQDVKDVVKGQSKDGAKSTLKSRYGIEDVDVEMTPGWAPRLPRFDFRISVKLGVRPVASDSTPKQSNNATPTAAVTPAASARP